MELYVNYLIFYNIHLFTNSVLNDFRDGVLNDLNENKVKLIKIKFKITFFFIERKHNNLLQFSFNKLKIYKQKNKINLKKIALKKIIELKENKNKFYKFIQNSKKLQIKRFFHINSMLIDKENEKEIKKFIFFKNIFKQKYMEMGSFFIRMKYFSK